MDHNWPGYLEHIGRLGIDKVNIWPVVDILMGCVQQYYTECCKSIVHNVQSLLDETYHDIILTSTEFNTFKVFITSLQTFTNYIGHTLKSEITATMTTEVEPTQCPSPASSEVALAQLMNYSDISSLDTDGAHRDTAMDGRGTGPVRRNRKSKKDRSKTTIQNTQRCIIPDCFSCAKENVVNLTGKPLSRQQITLLSKGLSFIPRTPDSEARELSNDLGQFIKKTKIKCGKLLVKSKKENQMKNMKSNRHNGTPSISQEDHSERKQTDWTTK